MTTVGLYVYKITMHDAVSHAQIDMAANGIGASFSTFLPLFINSKATLTTNQQAGRSWLLMAHASRPGTFHGVIKYGTHGHTSVIIDPNTNQPLLRRQSHHVEQIPLYYQYYVGANRTYAMCAIQSFQTWSCVSAVNGDLASEFKQFSNDAAYLKFQKIMPSDLAVYANSNVKRLVLRKAKIPRDRFAALNGIQAENVDLEVNFSVRRKSVFGTLSDVTRQLRNNAANSLLLMAGVDLPEVTALVRVGGKLKKVGVIGPAVTAGVIDVSDDVVMVGGHPDFASISTVASNNIADFLEILG